MLNLRAALREPGGRWELAAWARNVTDETYFTSISGLPGQAYISGGGTAAARGFAGWYAPPRTVGLELSLRY